MSSLKKDIRVSTTPGSPGVPGDPGSPGRPAYCYQVTETEVVIHPAPGGHFVWNPGTVGSPMSGWVWIPGSGKDTIEYVTRTREVCLPAEPAIPPTAAVPASPASTVYNFNIGWNTGAISAAFFSGDRAFTFRIDPTSAGVVCGLNRGEEGQGYATIDYAFRAVNGKFVVMENGVALSDAEAFSADTVFSIQRVGSQLVYVIDGEIVYRSAAPYSGTLVADASLYVGGDQILEASFGAVEAAGLHDATISVGLQPMTVLAGDASGSVAVAFQPMTLTVEELHDWALVRLRPLTLLAGDKSGGVSVALQPMTLEAEGRTGDDLPAYAMVLVQSAPMTVSGVADAAYRALSMQPMQVLAADHRYGEVRAASAPCEVQAFDFFDLGGVAQLKGPKFRLKGSGTVGRPNTLRGTLPMRLIAIGAASGRARLPSPTLAASGTVANIGRARLAMGMPKVVMTGTVANIASARLRLFPRPRALGVGGALARLSLRGFSLTASGQSANVGRAALHLPALSLMAAGSAPNVGRMLLTMPVPQMARVAQAVLQLRGFTLRFAASAAVAPTFEAYHVNLVSDDPERGGREVSHWLGMPFLQVVRFRDRYYGVAATGVHLLGGDTDAGEPIAWDWETGLSDFGTLERKTPNALLLGGRLGEHAAVRVIAGDDAPQTYEYQQPRGAGAQTHRQRFGRGIQGRYIGYGAADEQGGVLHLESLTPEIAPQKRRT